MLIVYNLQQFIRIIMIIGVCILPGNDKIELIVLYGISHIDTILPDRYTRRYSLCGTVKSYTHGIKWAVAHFRYYLQ